MVDTELTAPGMLDNKSYSSVSGDHEMKHWWVAVADLISGSRTLYGFTHRKIRRAKPSCQPLEERVTPSHFAVAHHLAASVHVREQGARNSTGTAERLPITAVSSTVTAPLPAGLSRTASSSRTVAWAYGGSYRHTTNSALQTALQNLKKDVQTIELASGTTVGELTAIRVAFNTLANDGLSLTSYSALQSFEDSLVTTNASSPGSLTNNAALLKQFEALYTSSPTTQQAKDLMTAYNDLAAAVTSAGVTSSDIATVNTDWSAVLAASNSTSTSTFPYFSLLAGQGVGICDGPMAL
jgi:hypothetical protein